MPRVFQFQRYCRESRRGWELKTEGLETTETVEGGIGASSKFHLKARRNVWGEQSCVKGGCVEEQHMNWKGDALKEAEIGKGCVHITGWLWSNAEKEGQNKRLNSSILSRSWTEELSHCPQRGYHFSNKGAIWPISTGRLQTKYFIKHNWPQSLARQNPQTSISDTLWTITMPG